MRYMIAYMLKGEPAWSVKRLADELADVFLLESPNKKLGPHLTLKAPFETNSERNIEDLKAALIKFCQGRKPVKISYDGFGQFDKRVIFVHIKPSQEAAAMTAELGKMLRGFQWIKFGRTDGEKHMHATICYAEKRSQYEELKKYLTGESVLLDGSIDSVAILEQEKDYRQPWKLLAEFSFAEIPVTPLTEPEL
jgi:2'-5' RNA ligase